MPEQNAIPCQAEAAMSRIVAHLASLDGTELYPAATDAQIADFERDQDVTLPATFKQWLRISDGGRLCFPAGIELFGVARPPLLELDDPYTPDGGWLVAGMMLDTDLVLVSLNGEETVIYNREGDTFDDAVYYRDFLAFLEDVPHQLDIEEDTAGTLGA